MAQLVERDLAKVEAAGSSPVSRSIVKAQKYREIGTPEFFVLSGSWYDLVRSKKIPDLHISEIAFICRHFMI